VIEPRAAMELEPDQARFRSDVRALGITSSADVLESAALGDPRGERALRLALNMHGPGYHAFVCGVEGPERLENVAGVVRSVVSREDSLPDWVYVHNFPSPDRPRAIRLRAGDGRRLAAELGALIRNLREDLPKAFREESFDEQKARIVASFEPRFREQQEALEEVARRAGFSLVIAPHGNIVLVPLVDGRPIENEAQLHALGRERLAALEKARVELEREIRELLEQQRDQHHDLDEEVRRIEREFASRIVGARVRALAAQFESPLLARHLEELAEHIVGHLEPFRGGEPSPSLPFPFGRETKPDDLSAYEVNVVVDNTHTETAPVLVVDSPTYKNLFGTIERSVDRFGQVTTDFRRIHAGALLEADGGVVIFNAEDALVEPFVWRILRRALRSGRVEIEAYDPFVGFTPAGIRPEPIQVSSKVVLVGPRWIFELLLRADDEFPNLFKILSDFSPVVERDADSTRALCGRVAGLVVHENLLPFESSALDALVELAVREAENQRKIYLGSESVLNAAREASLRATDSGHSKVVGEDVRGAIGERIYRLDRVEQALREAIDSDVLLVDLKGHCIGQVNGLSVAELGGHAFGRPSRLTAIVGPGAAGVVSIDRETKLSGALHDKGVLILEGFLRDRFARGRPLSLVASVVFEQSYGHVEGDSASLAELLAILSRLGGFPLRQDRAVTGSVNQLGEVQAIGGINEKIEGFFDCCRVLGAEGEHGVVFPAANVQHLVLREDVIEAMEKGEFLLLPVRSVEEALEALTGARAGSSLEEGSLYHQVDRALEALVTQMKSFGRSALEPGTS
jgi:ATP-dependent Lon protease